MFNERVRPNLRRRRRRRRTVQLYIFGAQRRCVIIFFPTESARFFFFFVFVWPSFRFSNGPGERSDNYRSRRRAGRRTFVGNTRTTRSGTHTCRTSCGRHGSAQQVGKHAMRGAHNIGCERKRGEIKKKKNLKNYTRTHTHTRIRAHAIIRVCVRTRVKK